LVLEANLDDPWGSVLKARPGDFRPF